ncbi:hypothetical protein ANRL3_00921 [Anaerolineae bacterium]|nr:hypothetical protein ANRL3_00921 [Anaerolineae bacterium]
MSFGHSVETVLTRLGQPNNDVARFCFEGAVKRILGQSAHRLLMALSLFANGTSRNALEYVTDLGKLDCDDGLVVLEKLSLVNKDGGRFSLLPLTLTYLGAELQGQPELEQTYRERWVTYFIKFLNEQRKNADYNIPVIEPDAGNIINVVEWCAHHDLHPHVIALVRGLDSYLWRTGNWHTMYHFYELGLNAAILSTDLLNQARLLRLMSNVRNFQGELEESERLALRALSLDRQTGDKSELALILFRLANIAQARQDYPTAQDFATEGLAMAQETGDHRYVARLLGRLGQVKLAQGELEAAATDFKKALEIFASLGPDAQDHWPVAWVNRALGLVCFKQGDYSHAREYYQKSLEISERIASMQDLAETKRNIAELELALGNFDRAEQVAQEALDVFDKLGMKKNLPLLRDMIGTIRAAR